MQVWDDHDSGNKFTSIIRRNTGYPYSFDCGNITLSGGCVQEMDYDSEDLGLEKALPELPSPILSSKSKR